MKIQMHKVVGSSNIGIIGHNGEDLLVKMKGGTYVYIGVPVQLYVDMMRAESAGKFLNSEIKPNYTHAKIEDLVSGTDWAEVLRTFELASSAAEDETGPSVKVTLEEITFEVRHTGTLVMGSELAAAQDLVTMNDFILQPGQRILVSTGVRVEMPRDMAALVVPRSGLALKHGITVVNAPGLIDPDYTGEIGVVLLNTSIHEVFRASAGDRIAQLMFTPVLRPKLVKVESLETTTGRGDGGFGSTGIAQATEIRQRTKSA